MRIIRIELHPVLYWKHFVCGCCLRFDLVWFGILTIALNILLSFVFGLFGCFVAKFAGLQLVFS